MMITLGPLLWMTLNCFRKSENCFKKGMQLSTGKTVYILCKYRNLDIVCMVIVLHVSSVPWHLYPKNSV